MPENANVNLKRIMKASMYSPLLFSLSVGGRGGECARPLLEVCTGSGKSPVLYSHQAHFVKLCNRQTLSCAGEGKGKGTEERR